MRLKAFSAFSQAVLSVLCVLRFSDSQLGTRDSFFFAPSRLFIFASFAVKSFSPDPPVLPAQAAIPEVDPVMSNFSIDPDSPLR